VPKALDRSLARLGRDSVELYQVHMAPRTMSIPTLMRELAIAHRDGRVRAIGVSNFNAAQTRLAHAALADEGIPLASNQMQYSLLHRKPETNGVLDACRELGITLVAYMPLASGALTGRYHSGNRPGGIRRFMPLFRHGNLDAIKPVIGLLGEIGRAHDAAPATIALRWLIQRGTLPIPGAKNAEQARTNAAALTIELDDAEMNALSTATEPWRR
jgi:aryl-alcohol dehydrogenase-like predicted oxidoreductase